MNAVGENKIRRKRASETFTRCQTKSARIIFIERKTELWPKSTKKKAAEKCEKTRQKENVRRSKI